MARTSNNPIQSRHRAGVAPSLNLNTTIGLQHLDIYSVLHISAIFTWVSKVICVYFGFELLRLVIGLKIWRHFLDQSDVRPNLSQVKPKSIVTCSRKFSCALCDCSELYWTMDCSVPFVIGQSNYFCIDFTTLNWKLLYKYLFISFLYSCLFRISSDIWTLLVKLLWFTEGVFRASGWIRWS